MFKTMAERIKEAQRAARESIREGRKNWSLEAAQAQIKERQKEKAKSTGKAKRAARRAEHEEREREAKE